MGRALHVSRSFPPIISSARFITSIEGSKCISSSAENYLFDCINGELPLYNRSYPNRGFSSLPALKSALGPKGMFRACQNSIGGVLARCFSSGSDVSESEWTETDDDHGSSSGHDGVLHRDRSSSPLFTKVHQARQMAYGTEIESDAEAVASTSRQMESDEEEQLRHGRQQLRWPPSSAKFENGQQARQGACEAETSGAEVVSRTSQWMETHEYEHMHHGRRKLGWNRLSGKREQVQQAQQAAYKEMDSETDAETVSSTSQSDEEERLHHRRSNSETDEETVANASQSDEEERLHHRRPKSGMHRMFAKPERMQQAWLETKSETDVETLASTSDEDLPLYHGRLRSKEKIVVEAGSSSSDWQETDDENLVQEQRHGNLESKVEAAGPNLSDWGKSDEDEPVRLWREVYESEGEQDGANAHPISLASGRDVSHLKISALDKSRGGRKVPERPSKKERSSGLSPRLIRDDDSDDIEIESDLEGELQDEIERQMAAEPKFERPSITWGILLTRDLKMEARANLLAYLEAEGMNTTELKRVELPTKVEVMQTRLGFLRKIGLDNDAINNYPLILGCSVQKNMVPVLKYLKKLGIPQAWVPILLKKYPMILHASVVIDILPVIYFLRGLDIHALDLPRVIIKYPDVLGFKTEGTMSTSVAYLVSMGVTLRHVGYMLTEFPEILGMRVASVIKPKFEYLMSLGIPQLIVAKILQRRPHLLGYHLENRLQTNVNQLLELGVRKEAIPGMVAQYPELLGRVFVHYIKDHVDWFKEHLELDSDGTARMIEKMPQVIFMPTAMAKERIRFLKSERFTAAEIGSMVTQCPQILVSSICDSLRPNLAFLTKVMKRSRAELLDFPAFFTYSLYARIRPRFNVLTARDAHCSLDWLLNCSDLEFKNRVDAGYDGGERPWLEFVMGGRLPGKSALEEVEFQQSEQRKVATL